SSEWGALRRRGVDRLAARTRSAPPRTARSGHVLRLAQDRSFLRRLRQDRRERIAVVTTTLLHCLRRAARWNAWRVAATRRSLKRVATLRSSAHIDSGTTSLSAPRASI